MKTIVKQLRNGEINEMIIDPKELKVNAEGFDKLVGNDAKYKKPCNNSAKGAFQVRSLEN